MDDTLNIDIIDQEHSSWKIPIATKILESDNWFECYSEEDLILRVNKNYVLAIVY